MLVSTRHLAHFLCSSVFVFPGHPLAVTYAGQFTFHFTGPKAHYVVGDSAAVIWNASGRRICHSSLRDGNSFHHSESESFSVMSNSSTPWILQSMEFSRILEWVAFPFSRDLPNSGIEPGSPTLQADSLPAKPQGKRPHGLQPTRLLHPWDFPGKNTRVGCHCLLWVNTLLTPKFTS